MVSWPAESRPHPSIRIPPRGEVRREPNGRAVGVCGTVDSGAATTQGRARASAEGSARRLGRHLVGSSHGSSLERSSRPISATPDVSPKISAVVPRRDSREGPACARPSSLSTGAHRHNGGVYRRHLFRGQKGGSAVGKTKKGKGTKIMAIADRSGLPVAAWISSASPAEVKLVEETIDAGFLRVAADHLPVSK